MLAPRICMRVPPKSTCYGCTDRKVGCHGTCEQYAEYMKKKDEEYWKMRDAYRGEWLAGEFTMRSVQAAADRRESKRR